MRRMQRHDESARETSQARRAAKLEARFRPHVVVALAEIAPCLLVRAASAVGALLMRAASDLVADFAAREAAARLLCSFHL